MRLQPMLFDTYDNMFNFGYNNYPTTLNLPSWSPLSHTRSRVPYRRLRSPSPVQVNEIPEDFWEPVVPQNRSRLSHRSEDRNSASKHLNHRDYSDCYDLYVDLSPNVRTYPPEDKSYSSTPRTRNIPIQTRQSTNCDTSKSDDYSYCPHREWSGADRYERFGHLCTDGGTSGRQEEYLRSSYNDPYAHSWSESSQAELPGSSSSKHTGSCDKYRIDNEDFASMNIKDLDYDMDFRNRNSNNSARRLRSSGPVSQHEIDLTSSRSKAERVHTRPSIANSESKNAEPCLIDLEEHNSSVHVRSQGTKKSSGLHHDLVDIDAQIAASYNLINGESTEENSKRKTKLEEDEYEEEVYSLKVKLPKYSSFLSSDSSHKYIVKGDDEKVSTKSRVTHPPSPAEEMKRFTRKEGRCIEDLKSPVDTKDIDAQIAATFHLKDCDFWKKDQGGYFEPRHSRYRDTCTSMSAGKSAKKIDTIEAEKQYQVIDDIPEMLNSVREFHQLTGERKPSMSAKTDTKTPTSNITSPPSYPAYNIIREVIKEFDGQVDYIRGDGNCFFRALSKVIYGSESCHEEVRQAVVDLMEKFPKDLEQFVDQSAIHEHIVEMRKVGTWATQAEIYGAATLLQRDLYILSPDHTGDNYRWLLFSPLFIMDNFDFCHRCHVTLCHTNGNHYDRIAPSHGECNCGVPRPSLSGIKAKVDLTDEIV